jgi:hemerythrin-like domain-containing protein
VGRLHKLALKTNPLNVQKLQDATEYVIDFNLRGLHKIETGLFFPWMRQQLTSRPQDKKVSSAFSAVMEELEMERLQVAQLGRVIARNACVAGDTSNSKHTRSAAIEEVADQSAKLEQVVRLMMEVEDEYLVPAVAALVSEKDQKSFSNKVLLGLGLLDSRLHLVSMYEAVEEDTNRATEKELFRKNIPSVPQMMIPRWKRKLYAPKTYMLE